MAFIDLSGKRFGRLVVIRRAGVGKQRDAKWFCQCDCGSTAEVLSKCLRRGFTKSCGCLKNEGNNRSHGHARRYCHSDTYKSWASMRDRCLRSGHKDWKHYGGQGVKICDRWGSFENFLLDMGERPKGMTLDRIDPYGDYEKGNCRWADAITQRNNRRRKSKI